MTGNHGMENTAIFGMLERLNVLSVTLWDFQVIVGECAFDPATADNALHPKGMTDTAQGSGDVFAYGKQAHRKGDKRACSASTIVEGNQTVFVNEKLWAVKGDPESHGEGRLINTGTTVLVQGIPVIVH